MNNKVQKNRDQIDARYMWNIEKMYPMESQWETDLNDALQLAEKFATLQGSITKTAEHLQEAIELYAEIMRKAEHAFVYSRMRHDEDNSNSKYTEMNNKALSVMAQISAAVSFFIPEVLSAPEETIRAYMNEDGLQTYHHMLDSLLREKAHVLTAEEENILAVLGESLSAPHEAFTMLNNADMVFGTITDEDGQSVEITHGNFIQYMESEDRNVRQAAFTAVYDAYKSLNNTISVLYNYNVKTDVITSKLRKYDSSLSGALNGENIPVSVYENLIDAVHHYLPSMHQYVSIRKRVLGLEDLKMYDVYRPLVKPAGLECTFEEAVDIACKALAPLGEEYVEKLRDGLLNERWVDVMENRGKTSGAYSFGSYDSDPYILMNFAGDLKDIFTLIHEGGHSMHSYYTRKTQPFIYGSHSIFTAEVASTVNETLLIHYLLNNTESEEMRTYLINFYIDEFKSTLFRQTMFAEFEKKAHETVEQGGSLTADYLNSMYAELNANYFGPEMGTDEYIQYEWSRIPHFYRSYYVYQYATGYSAANAIANRILSGGTEERNDYLRFLTLGDSDDPIELLKVAGVDMSTEEPVRSALSTFASLVDELDTRF